jgi:Tfp pilus assembly protein PilF
MGLLPKKNKVFLLIFSLLAQYCFATESSSDYQKLRQRRNEERARLQLAVKRLRKCIGEGEIQKCLNIEEDPEVRAQLLSVYLKYVTPKLNSDPMMDLP